MKHVPDVQMGVTGYGSSVSVSRYNHDLSVVESLFRDVRDSGVPELMKSNATF